MSLYSTEGGVNVHIALIVPDCKPMTFEQYPRTPERKLAKLRLGIFVALLVVWLPSVIWLYGIEEVAERAGIAFSAFLSLSIMAIPLFAIGNSIAYLGNWPERQRRRRLELGQCVGCGYSLRGNVSGICPECGMKI